jgi:hypothetical protein
MDGAGHVLEHAGGDRAHVRDDAVGARLFQPFPRHGVEHRDRRELRCLGRAYSSGRVLDGDRATGDVLADDRGERLDAQEVALRIGLARRGVLRADDGLHAIADAETLERDLDLVAQRPRDHHHRSERGDEADELRGTGKEERFLGRTAEVDGLLRFHQPIHVRAGRRAAVVAEDGLERALVVEGEVATEVVLLRERDAEIRKHLRHARVVQVLVVDEDTVEVEQRGERHGSIPVTSADAP